MRSLVTTTGPGTVYLDFAAFGPLPVALGPREEELSVAGGPKSIAKIMRMCPFGHRGVPEQTVTAALDCTRPTLCAGTAMADHGRVRRAYEDPIEQADSKHGAKQPPRHQAPNDATDGGALIEALQRGAGNAAVGALFADQHSRVSSAQSGEALTSDIRASAERKLGADLGDVRVHSDATAAEYAASLHAQAVTVDKDVFLAPAVNTRTSRGQKTLLHELVHAAQSPGSSAEPSPGAGRPASDRGPAEAEARRISAAGFGGSTARPQEHAPSAVPHLSPADDDESVPATEQHPQAGPTAEQLLNPDESTDAAGPQPGTSGGGEGVAFEITVMQPLRAAQQAVEEQDWDKAYEVLQSIGMQLIKYQNAYEKSDPMLHSTLMSARGWLSVFYQQLERRLDRDVWTDDHMTDFFKSDVVGEFQRIEGLLH